MLVAYCKVVQGEAGANAAAPDGWVAICIFNAVQFVTKTFPSDTLQPKNINLNNPLLFARIIQFCSEIFPGSSDLSHSFPTLDEDCIAEKELGGVYLGKLMSGHLLSLSRCLLNSKKENRGEYLERIFAQNIGVAIHHDNAKITIRLVDQSPQPKTGREKKGGKNCSNLALLARAEWVVER